MISSCLRHLSLRRGRIDSGAVNGVIKDLVRRSESGRLLSAANSLARIHRSNAVKSEQNQPTTEEVGLPERTSQHSTTLGHSGGSCADSLFIALIISGWSIHHPYKGYISYPPIS